MEEHFHRGLGCDCHCDWILDSRTVVPANSGCGGGCDGGEMMQGTPPLFDELKQRFGARVESTAAAPQDETYLLLRDSDIRGITQYLRREFGARLVTVFAEDRRAAENPMKII